MQDINHFIENHCTGKDFDSCKNSPCRFANLSGCQHPEHPKNKKDETLDLAKAMKRNR